MPGITSLRGIAALWVVVYHLVDLLPSSLPAVLRGFFEYGYLGVDLFFLMSGFIISFVHWAEFEDVDRRTTLNFMVKRIGRIYPLHLFMLLVYITIPIAILTLSTARTVPDAYSVSTFILNFLLVHASGIISYASWNFPSWSISVEFFAYLLFPIIAWAGHRSKSYVQDRMVFIFSLIVLAVVFKLDGRADINVMFGFSLVRGILEFTAGCFLFKMFVAHKNHTIRDSALIAIGFAVVAVSIAPYDYVVWPAACAFVIVLAASAQSLRLTVLCAPILVFVGEISYSIYMSHAYVRAVFKFIFVNEGQPLGWPLVAAYFVVVFAVSIALYYVIEKPARAWSRRVGENLVEARVSSSTLNQ